MTVSKKYSLITGSTKGIGKQIAIDLLKENIYVILNYAHSDSEAKKTRDQLSKISNDFSIIKSDLSLLDNLNAFIESVKKITHRIDYLILNAAITKRSSFEEVTVDDWMHVFNANLNIPFFIIQRLNSILQDNGNIIFIGALLGITPHATSIPYGVSKSSLGMLAKYLVRVFAQRKITVNVIAPGFVDTSWQNEKSPALRKKIENKISLKRFAKPEEISDTCLHLLKNSYINGQTILIDGGYGMEYDNH